MRSRNRQAHQDIDRGVLSLFVALWTMQVYPLSSADDTISYEHDVMLFFTHGCGICKETQTPVINRLLQTTLFQQVRVEMVSMDCAYHGTRSDNTQAATLDMANPSAPRISHPAEHWPGLLIDDIRSEVRLLRENQAKRKAIIGIGHSMGGASLWEVEAASPGTFDGLILFEPTCNLHEYQTAEMSINWLVSTALTRASEWNSMEEAEAYFRSTKTFARWHPEALDAYIKGAVIESNSETYVFGVKSAYTLACHPHIEAAHY